MIILDAAHVHEALHYPEFIDSLEATFAGDFTMPQRQVMLLDESEKSHDAFAMLPAWNDEVIALKSFTYFPENQAPDLSVYAKILLFSRKNGVPLAVVDGTAVTYYRTAGVSALASRLLSRQDSKHLFLLGTGNLAAYLVRAHVSVRDLEKVTVWGRDSAKAQAVIDSVRAEFPQIEFAVAESIENACGQADVIVSATGSPDVLVEGEWVKSGTHCDFLGNHHADKRECDTNLILKSRVYLDSAANCMKEAGEVLIPIKEKVFSADQIIGDLSQLAAQQIEGRLSESDITVFKSVGCALGDLCGAKTVYENNV